jgi:hypothetical protein
MVKSENIATHKSYREIFLEHAPNRLWHYTDAPGLIGIATSKSLYCSEYRHFFDRSEIWTFSRLFQNQIRKRLLKAELPAESADSIVDQSNLFITWYIFISSFCADHETDHHWRQFSKKAGYALGFDTAVLARIAEQQGFLLGPVFYGEETLGGIANAVLSDKLPNVGLPLADNTRDELSMFVCRQILELAPFFKREKFRSEKEWRLVKVVGIADLANIGFRPHPQFGLKAYLEFDSMEILT